MKTTTQTADTIAKLSRVITYLSGQLYTERAGLWDARREVYLAQYRVLGL